MPRKTVIVHVGTSALFCKALTTAQSQMSRDERAVEMNLIKGIPASSGAAIDPNALEAIQQRWQHDFVRGLQTTWRTPLPTDASLTPEERAALVKKSESEKRRAASAEIASLHILQLKAGDRIVLVCSKTPDGHFCGQLLQAVLETTDANRNENLLIRPNDLEVHIEQVPGLDIADGKNFVNDGLPAYLKMIGSQVWNKQQRALRLATQDELIFNITGGYKGTIPFAVLASQLLETHPHRRVQTEIVYVPEHDEQAISLVPAIPVDWKHLDEVYQGIALLVEQPGSAAARSLDARYQPYRERADPSQPNALAKTIFYLTDEMQWR